MIHTFTKKSNAFIDGPG